MSRDGIIQKSLLDWYDENGRELPWRAKRSIDHRDRGRVRESRPNPTYPVDPYRVWISEVMLIQTQVERVLPYYRRFLERFPDVRTLAAAELDDVLKAWEGLGYYSRARNLHEAARLVVQEHAGELPSESSSLRALPGVGDYVAPAVASIAFGERALALDANARRVLSRLYDDPDPGSAQMHERANPLVDCERPGDINQALMDLGSIVCTPRAPRCDVCPLAGACLARQRRTIKKRPRRTKRKPRPHHVIAAGVIWRDGEILIAQRPPQGLLGGLWEFPGGKVQDGETVAEAVVREVREELDVEIEPEDELAVVDHSYSHFSITLHAVRCRYLSGDPKPIGCQHFAWARVSQLDDYALPAANRKVLAKLATAPVPRRLSVPPSS